MLVLDDLSASEANKILKNYRMEMKPDYTGLPYGSLELHRVLHPPALGMRTKELKNSDEGHAKMSTYQDSDAK